MATILDLPDEIHLLIAKHLKTKIIFYSLIRVCHSFYSTYFPCLWSDLYVDPGGGKTIDATNLRINAHLVDSITFSPSLTEEYYTIDFPRLYTLRLETFYYPEGLLARQVDFMRRHPFIRKLVCQHKDPVPREFWEVIVTEWTHLEVFHFSGIVEKDAQDAFWMVPGVAFGGEFLASLM
ncbi:hypothetical protein BGZ96_006060 [Linnemannia gamsii]|uniref:F-box domain-containing protein n=1 Tax=Linnemannia gamsii TaxID=64522 RepID=A0ABQ7K3T2_9FUNG|nr:hypothetical protein BGZ96_006060 [Linnemannia gamsii]